MAAHIGSSAVHVDPLLDILLQLTSALVAFYAAGLLPLLANGAAWQRFAVLDVPLEVVAAFQFVAVDAWLLLVAVLL